MQHPILEKYWGVLIVRLISEEIYLREWEDEGTLRSYVYNDEELVKKYSDTPREWLFMVRYIFCRTTHVHYNAPMQGGHNKKEGAERSAKKQMII